MSLNDAFMGHMARQTDALERLAKRLAPKDQNHQTVIFNGETSGSKVMQLSGKFNKIEHQLTSGKVLVYLGGHGSNSAMHDFICDANVPGPIHFPEKEHRSIAFVVASGSAAVKGPIHVENY